MMLPMHKSLVGGNQRYFAGDRMGSNFYQSNISTFQHDWRRKQTVFINVVCTKFKKERNRK